MRKLAGILRAVIVPLGWICALLALVTPLWFLAAALGTKWGFIDLEFGLGFMTHGAGRQLLLACLVAGVGGLVLIVLHRLVGRRMFGVVASPVLALAVGAAGTGWAWHVDRQRAALPPVLDVTTDRADPPHFSPAFRARRPAGDQSLDYAGKRTAQGRPLAELQGEVYPAIATLHVDRAPEAVFDAALDYAYARHWRIGTASSSAGMFEAVTESVWYGLRDDIVVRVRADGNGGSLVDMRSLARQPVHDLGRNARRVRAFIAAMEDGDR